MSRRTAREAALQVLYQIDIGKVDTAVAVTFVKEENNLNDNQLEFLRKLVDGVLENLNYINKIINEVSIDWDVERMASVDRNVLRMALYELCYSEDVPANVAANEAIELGKKFGSGESGKFINGILGKVISNLDKYRKQGSNIGV